MPLQGLSWRKRFATSPLSRGCAFLCGSVWRQTLPELKRATRYRFFGFEERDDDLADRHKSDNVEDSAEFYQRVRGLIGFVTGVGEVDVNGLSLLLLSERNSWLTQC